MSTGKIVCSISRSMSMPAQMVIRRVPSSRFSERDSTIPWIRISTDSLKCDSHWQSSRCEYFSHTGKIMQPLLAR
jgi:hypothetical protein